MKFITLLFLILYQKMVKFLYVHIVDGSLDMSINEEQELLTLTRDNNKMLKDIWTLLHQGSPNDDFKDFIINVIANQIGGRR